SSRATTAAGTRPPRVTATIPFHGPLLASRQASALALRCSSSHDTGKVLGLVAGVTGGGLLLARGWSRRCSPGDAARAMSAASDAGVGGGGDEAAADLPAAVGLALHLVVGEHAGAVGPDEEDLLHHADVVAAGELAELHDLGPVDRGIGGLDH